MGPLDEEGDMDLTALARTVPLVVLETEASRRGLKLRSALFNGNLLKR